MLYRKKPVVVEAMEFTVKTKDQVYNFILGNGTATMDDHDNPTLTIHTLEGKMVASIGDYVIKGVHGEFYPCKSDIFWKTYEIEENYD